MVDARLPDGSRVNAIIPPLALRGPTLTIRKFSRDPYTLADLASFGALTPSRGRRSSRACVRGKVNILISGGTGSGKTTLLNALSGFVPGNERIVTIEDAAELQLQQRHVVSLEARPPNIEGEGEVRIRELVRNALRMRPDRIIVGEVRGAETLDMLQAMNTGHEGSLTTIHANTPRDALHRLEMLVLMGGVELPVRAIREQIAVGLRPDRPPRPPRRRQPARQPDHRGLRHGRRRRHAAGPLHRPLDRGRRSRRTAAKRCSARSARPGLRPSFLPKLATHGVDLPGKPVRGGLRVSRRARATSLVAATALCLAGISVGRKRSRGVFRPPRRRDRVSDRQRRRPSAAAEAAAAVRERAAARRRRASRTSAGGKAIVLAIDRSKSMRGAPLLQAAAAAASFVHRKPQSDPSRSSPSAPMHCASRRRLSQATIDADTVLLHAVDRTTSREPRCTTLSSSPSTKLAAQTYPGRVLILLTDGRDVRSLATLNDAVRSARRAGVVVYAIALGHARPAPLRRLARETGGSLYASATPSSLGGDLPSDRSRAQPHLACHVHDACQAWRRAHGRCRHTTRRRRDSAGARRRCFAGHIVPAARLLARLPRLRPSARAHRRAVLPGGARGAPAAPLGAHQAARQDAHRSPPRAA